MQLEVEIACHGDLKAVTKKAKHKIEGHIILAALNENNWRRKQTAKCLGISYRALLYKIKAMEEKTLNRWNGEQDGV